MGCDTVRWQDATTLRAPARKEEQRRKQAVARLNRVRRAVTPMVAVLVGTKVSVHKVWPAQASGQLRFLALILFSLIKGLR